jgi:NPCBM/NEW2 domain
MRGGQVTSLTDTDAHPNLCPDQPRGYHTAELLTAFAVGFVLMLFFYVDPRTGTTSGAGVPGYDAFYHIKMAALLPQIGFVTEFPWLREVYFSQLNTEFISHHVGFHVLLAPFVKLSYALTGDYLAGGRWAIATFFGLSMLAIDLLMINERIRWRWLWLIVFLMLPSEFFVRHAYVRAISPSLMFMIAIITLMFAERYVLTGVAIAAYSHLYLGSVVYTPVIVGLYVLSSALGPRGDRCIPWRLIMWSMLGWLVGLRTYVYFDGALEFLRMQILGTGLDPDIAVGSEWSAYGNVWHFAVQMCGPLLGAWAIALVLRIRIGDRLNAKEIFLVLLNFAFLFLTFKAKRFIEYWPVFCLLSAAFLAAPILNPIAEWFDSPWRGTERRRSRVLRLGVTASLAGLVVAVILWRTPANIDSFVSLWPTWTALATAAMVPILATIWLTSSAGSAPRRATLFAVPLLGAGVVGAALLFVGRAAFGEVATSTPPAIIAWPALLLPCVAGLIFSRRRQPDNTRPSTTSRIAQTVVASVGGVGVAIAIALVCAPRLATVQRSVNCGFNLPAIKNAMAYLKTVSQPGDVVFTDDWDVFPVYFYHNSYNNYIVGLDPKFTHARRPELWERYVKITRGLSPRTFEASWTGDSGERVSRKIAVKLEDIRDRFNAGYVITDSDHKALSNQLAHAADFAELIYPTNSFKDSLDAPYLIFKIRQTDDRTSTAIAAASQPSEVVYLSDLEPLSASQGWGELTNDRSVTGEPINVGGKFYVRGLGTHTPSEIMYAVPEGFDEFKAVVGINPATNGQGSATVAVIVDDREEFRSEEFTAASDPIEIRVRVAGAQHIVLQSDPASDGNTWDHVDWARARFTRSTTGPKPSPVQIDRRKPSASSESRRARHRQPKTPI